MREPAESDAVTAAGRGAGEGEAAGPPRSVPARGARWLWGLLGLAVLIALAGAGLLTLARERRETAERSRRAEEARRGPPVLVGRVSRAEGSRKVTLPGDVRPLWQSTLYAKVNGYVTEMAVDKGDRVRRGQVLARISSPETDDQVRSAQATFALRRRSWERVQRLAPTGYVSQVDIDQAETDLAAARAELQRVRSLQGYEVLRAPFDGVVTTRYVDPGALLTASASGAPVVDLADPQRMTVYLYVGQDVAPFVRLGDPAEVSVDAQPGLRIPAHVARTAGAIDPRTRAMLVQLDVGEGEGAGLVPGLFVHVELQVQAPHLPSVPSDALVSRGDRLQVATILDGRLHFVDVVPGDTDGRQLQIREGLRGDEEVALSPPSELGEGAPVQAIARGEAGGTAPRHASR